ncbi:hypothetical protein JMJ35_004740 [Cladonia borealis]|uniref:Uncharacterized protein n=1 Tax=Cladonia borealis TaxID=184061 RepID=A0AA39R3L6_9LECA|nr:hypothetical protein JMJ35_004740 [Cladonia borealis]
MVSTEIEHMEVMRVGELQVRLQWRAISRFFLEVYEIAELLVQHGLIWAVIEDKIYAHQNSQENRILKELLRVNGIPFIPTPATIDDLPLRNNGLVTNQTYDSNWTSPDFNGMDSTSPAADEKQPLTG